MESSASTSTSQKRVPRNWMEALHRKFSVIYMEKFTRFFDEPDVTEDWLNTWGEALSDMTGEEIKYGLSIVATNHPWPPTMGEFNACCKAAPKPYVPSLPSPKVQRSEHSEKCMERIRALMENPRKAGIWWKQQVRDQVSLGMRVSVAALELANSGRQE